MSRSTDVLSFADSAFDRGRSTLRSVPEQLVSRTSDARERARSSTQDGRGLVSSVISLTRRQAYVNVGVSDAVLATLTKRTAELPEDARSAAATVLAAARERARDAADRTAQAQDKLVHVAAGIKNRATDTVDSARSFSLSGATSTVRDDVQSRLDRILDGLGKFAERGEQVAEDLRHDPLVARVITEAGNGVEQAANEVTSVAQKLRARAAAQVERESAAVTSTPVRPVAPDRIPTHKTTVRKTPAGEAAVSPTPTHRAAAHEVEVRKAAGLKAAETRRENAEAAEQATQARKTAAKKAARRRKAAAEQAAAKRSAASLKAAETRKHNAEVAERATTVRKTTAVKAPQTPKPNGRVAAGATTAAHPVTS